MKHYHVLALSAALAGCAAHPITYERQGDVFVYPVSDQQAMAECEAQENRDARNFANGSFDEDFWRGFDRPAIIRACMEGRGYVAVRH